MPARIYFLGVSTGASSVHRIFPHWMELVGVRDGVLEGIDLPVGSPPEAYRAVAMRMKNDPNCWGALVTTHKVAFYRHAGDLFDGFDDDAQLLGEVSCVVCRQGRLRGLAIDTLTAKLGVQALLGGDHFDREALIMGAGGAGLALAVVLRRHFHPSRVVLTDRSKTRLAEIPGLVDAEKILVLDASDHDRLIHSLGRGSLIVNATGLGKDLPGSPVTDAVRFPTGATAWDFNYRGDLRLLELARRVGIRAVDGWEYFLHGWSQITARILGFEVTGELFEKMRLGVERP